LLSVSLLKNYKVSVIASPSTLTVGTGPEDFKTIQEAINNATDGDTIFVRNGTYYENVIINKSITLMGENRDFTIINGNKTGHVVTIEANNVSIQGFTIMKSGGDIPYSGIFVKPPYTGNVITSNEIIENYYGISLFSSNNIVSGNLISKNTYGISLTSCGNNIVSNNTIFSSINDGICFFSSFNNFVSNNFNSFNGLAGFSLYNSEGNMVFGNTISNDLFYGIFLYSSSDNVFSTNTIVNHLYGISLTFSNNNTIYHNNFNNTVQVWTGDSINVWSCNGEGNYWIDHSGEDLNEDGIGDVPYIIDGNNADNSPLMGMFSEFGITYKGETYHATIISNSTISDFQFQIGVETGNKILRFEPRGNESVVGFCRIMIPTGFMSYPYILLLDNEEISPTFLDVSNETHVYLYFTYLHKNQNVTIISSELYSELLCIYHDLNATYYNLLYGYTLLLGNYTQLQKSFEQLNASYQYLYDLNATFYNFLGNYSRLQEDFHHLNETYYNLTNIYGELQKDFYDLNITYYGLFNSLVLLLGNYTQLQEDYQELNASYQDHLRSYSENVSNVQNLTYILAAMTAILIILTTYLSKRAHGNVTPKINRFEEE
jgi:parallel beta-helix repeat protein